MKKKYFLKLVFLGLLVFVLQAQYGFAQTHMNMAPQTAINKAVCMVYPTQGNTVNGIITFVAIDGGIKVVADLHGLTPGKHGFHIHECGDCSAIDGTSAGGHFNPRGKQHGAPMDQVRHMGDMGNIEADASGNAHLEYIDNSIQLNGPESIIGRGIIIHNSEDDLKTQPTGNAGARVACGVIGIAK
jgi:superoxide dismutase, Cu-Zn family